MTAIRAFIAIELPADLQIQLRQIITRLQAKMPQAVRWVAYKNIHLTLKFLGSVSPANLQSLTQAFQSETTRHPAMQLTVGGLGAFPNKLRPRVIWVGVTAPQELLALVGGIDRETARLGYPSDERGFSPHLTLGRVSQHATPQDIHSIAEALAGESLPELGTVQVDSVRLFRSDLQPGGAIYTPLFSAPLAK